MTLGERIIELRTDRGLSQLELAEAMEVSRQSVSKWETGASTPDLDKLVKLADYFGLTLDQLVKGEAPKKEGVQEEPQGEAKTAACCTAPHRTRAQSVGLLFFGISAVAAIVLTMLLGFAGLLLVLPLLLFGGICYFAKHHPILKAAWVNYILVATYCHWGTACDPSYIFMTFRWTATMNYTILVFSWVWFILIVALVGATAYGLRDLGWSWTGKQCAGLAAGVLLYGLGIVINLMAMSVPFTTLLYLVHFQLQLAGVAIIAVDLTRWLWSRRHQNARALR